jgi:hypothetical protein
MIHASGIFYLLGLAAIGWQTYLGYSIFTWSLLPLFTACCFLIAASPVVLLLQMKTNLPSRD